MAQMINGIKVPFIPLVNGDEHVSRNIHGSKSTFDSVFDSELKKIKFSGHASKRLESRNIELTEDKIQKLNEAVEKAEGKGSKDSLVMMDNTAFIVNIPSRVVVTAMEVAASEENVFTNIDSVVFAV